jgi:hypothetical protein
MNEQPRENKKGSVWNEPPKSCEKNVSTIKVLNAVNDNALMAKEATETILKFVDNLEFGDILRGHVAKYDEFCRKAQKLASNLGCTLESQNKAARSMAKVSLRMKLMMDSSVGKIAEIILLGTTNGIVDLGKLIRHTSDVGKETLALAKELLIFEEDKVELMKYHL